jgi:hypothetical protein
VVIALLGLVAITWLVPEYVVGANSDRGGVTPGFMPRVAAWCMIVLGGIVALNAFRVVLGKIPAVAEESEENETLVFGRNEIVDSFIIAVLSTAYVLGLVKLGFLIPSAIILGLIMYCTGYRKIIPLIAISIGFPALLEYLLWYVLKVPLPQFPLIIF